MKPIVLVPTIFAFLLVIGSPARAQRPAAKSLDDLLHQIKLGSRTTTSELKKREARFLAESSNRKALLAKAKARLVAEQRRGKALEQEFDENKTKIDNLKKTLKTRLGTMGEMFGVIRQVAGDTRARVEGSIVSAQFPNRGDSLEKLATSKNLPTVKELENLWWVLQHEMTESGKVVRFKAKVIAKKGEDSTRTMVRVGNLNAVSEGKFYIWNQASKKLEQLGRQPPARFLATAADLENAKAPTGFALDPSRGQVLSLLVGTPTLKERIDYGGVIGYTIIILGAITLLGGLARLLQLAFVSLSVRRKGGPLGRVLKVYEENKHAKIETLEHKLDAAILKESTKLDRFLWAVKIIAAIAPLMGLLGTVTGMIRTFQAIVLFGSGDPKMMASGISEALVTTMLGLIVAIPLVLLHSWLKNMSSRVVDILEEQSAGNIAKRAEVV
jgi:biopolymer transport protein ExbB